MRLRWCAFALLAAGCSSGATAEQKCDQLAATLCKKLFQCGAGSMYASEADCETSWESRIDCSQWVVPPSCNYDWGPFDQCLSDVANEACSDAQHGPPPTCSTAAAPPMCAGGPVFCTDHDDSSSGASCTYTISGCADQKTYAVSCQNGACTCQVNGVTTQPATGLTDCSADEAVLNPACGWNLFRTYRPEPPDLAPPADLSMGCTINGVFYPIGTVNPQNECQSCQDNGSEQWSDLDDVPCGNNGCGQCSAGMCGVGFVAYQQSNPTALAIDANYIYWLNTSSSGNVSKLALTGGNPSSPIVLADFQLSPTGLAIDGSNAYWTDQGSAAASGYLLRSGLTSMGGPGTQLTGSLTTPAAVVVDASNIYWVSQGTTGNNDGAILKIATTGGNGTPTTLASGLSSPLGITLYGGNVYWTNSGSGTVMKIAVGGAAMPTTIATGQILPSGIAVDANGVYWVNQGSVNINYTDGTVMKLPTGSNTPMMLASAQVQPLAITIDATNAYWTSARDGSVWKVPLAGGSAPTQLSSGQAGSSVQGIVVDNSCVYWTGFSSVQKAPK